MPNDRNEVSYYPEIQRYIEEQLKSNFRLTRQRDLFVFWGIGELKTKACAALCSGGRAG